MLKNNTRVLPLVVHHEGKQRYPKICLDAAKRYNKRVILLGNKENKKLYDDWYNVDEIDSELWERFQKSFVNLSNYDYGYCLQIFKRFFVLYEWMKSERYEECILLDSDVIVNVNFSKVEILKKYGASLSIPQNNDNYKWNANVGCSFWTIKFLEDFIYFIINIYENQICILEEKWNYHQKNRLAGGVCEMTLLYLWSVKFEKEILNTAKVCEENWIIDHNFLSSSNFLQNEYLMNKFIGVKKVKYIKGKQYFQNTDNILVRVYAVHCGLDLKPLMKSVCKNNYISYTISIYIRQIHRKIRPLLVCIYHFLKKKDNNF